jgi:predicted PurR-regulated permease PerM
MEAPRRVILVRPRTVLAVVGLAAAVAILLLLGFEVRRVPIWALIAPFVLLALDHVVAPLDQCMPGLFAVLGVYVVAAYQVVVENHLLVPVVYSRRVELSSLAVLPAVLVGAELAGTVGAPVAAPVLAADTLGGFAVLAPLVTVCALFEYDGVSGDAPASCGCWS